MQLQRIAAYFWLYCHIYIGCALKWPAPSKVRPVNKNMLVSSTIGLIDKPRRLSLLFMGLSDPPLELCEENLDLVIEEIKNDLGTLFGYDKASREVGITGELRIVDVDGPTVTIALSGRFWHATDTVMERVESYMTKRIPEIISVQLDLSQSAIVDDNRLNSKKVI